MLSRIAFLRLAALTVAGAALLSGASASLVPDSSPPTAAARPVPPAAAGAEPTPAPVPDGVKHYRSVRSVATVAPPVRLRIPSLGIKSVLERVGRRRDGTVEVPRRPERAAWYEEGAPPGRSGAAVILGHVDSREGPAVFYRLHTLRRGSSVVVGRADGSSVRFVVDKVEQHDKDAFPAEDVYFPTVRPTLRLVTCGGDYVQSAGGYQANVIVFASWSDRAVQSAMPRGAS